MAEFSSLGEGALSASIFKMGGLSVIDFILKCEDKDDCILSIHEAQCIPSI